MAQEEAGSGGGRKGSVPTGSRPTLRHPGSCPAPELGPASGRRLKRGRDEESCRRNRKNRSPCSLLQLRSATCPWEARLSGDLGPKRLGIPQV